MSVVVNERVFVSVPSDTIPEVPRKDEGLLIAELRAFEIFQTSGTSAIGVDAVAGGIGSFQLHVVRLNEKGIFGACVGIVVRDPEAKDAVACGVQLAKGVLARINNVHLRAIDRIR